MQQIRQRSTVGRESGRRALKRVREHVGALTDGATALADDDSEREFGACHASRRAEACASVPSAVCDCWRGANEAPG